MVDVVRRRKYVVSKYYPKIRQTNCWLRFEVAGGPRIDCKLMKSVGFDVLEEYDAGLVVRSRRVWSLSSGYRKGCPWRLSRYLCFRSTASDLAEGSRLPSKVDRMDQRATTAECSPLV